PGRLRRRRPGRRRLRRLRRLQRPQWPLAPSHAFPGLKYSRLAVLRIASLFYFRGFSMSPFTPLPRGARLVLTIVLVLIVPVVGKAQALRNFHPQTNAQRPIPTTGD